MIVKPVDIFMDWLDTRPKAARVAVVFDIDRLLGRGGVLGRNAITDKGGRQWQMVVFRGDDLSFRLRFRKAVSQPPVLMILTRGENAKGPIDLSYLADLLSKDEGGDPLDLSLVAFFKRLCPKINFPASELRRHVDELLEDIERVPAAAAKIVEKWGRPDDWGRGQVTAMVLLAKHPELSLRDLWSEETEPVEFVVHALRILIGRLELADDHALVQEMIREAARPQVRDHLHWLDISPSELSAYLVLRRFADVIELQNPSMQLAGLQVFSPDTRLAEMEAIAVEVAIAMEKDLKAWTAVDRLSQEFFNPRRLERARQLLPRTDRQPETLADAVRRPGIAPIVLKLYLRDVLASFLDNPSVSWKRWAPVLSDHPLLGASTADLSTGAQQCRAMIEFILLTGRVEERLLLRPPRFAHAEGLLEWYVSTRHHCLEMDVTQAFHHLEACNDEEMLRVGTQYLFGGPFDLDPSEESLKGRVRTRLNELDQALAEFIRPDPIKFARGPQSALGLLNGLLSEVMAQISDGASDGRIWVLLFDGMRYDTWEMVVQPLLAQYFSVDGKPYFCVLPSYTQIARTSLFAGGLPEEWRNYKGASTTNEAILAARNLGLTEQESRLKLRLIAEADTLKARNIMGFSDSDVKAVNILIYPISDECHEFRGDVVAFNNKIRTEILGDRTQGVRGILDDILRRVRPQDTMLITSDHGFIELLVRDGVEIKQSEAQSAGRAFPEDVRYRYLRGFGPANAPDAVEVPGVPVQHHLAVGRTWFRREGAKIAPRYEHGGLSLSEMIVPGAILRRVTEKEARAEIVALPVIALVLEEDARSELSFAVQNVGNIPVDFEMNAETNLGEELPSVRGKLAPQATHAVGLTLLARYRQTAAQEVDPSGTLTAVTIRLRHTDLKGKWREAIDGVISIPVKIKPKKTRLDTEALKGLDDV